MTKREWTELRRKRLEAGATWSDDISAVLAEVERLRAVHETTCRDTSRVIEDRNARISAALAECESTEKCDVACNLPSRVVQALRGEPAQGGE